MVLLRLAGVADAAALKLNDLILVIIKGAGAAQRPNVLRQFEVSNGQVAQKKRRLNRRGRSW